MFTTTVPTKIADVCCRDAQNRYAIGNVRMIATDYSTIYAATDGTMAAVVETVGSRELRESDREDLLVPRQAFIPPTRKSESTMKIADGATGARDERLGHAELATGRFPGVSECFSQRETAVMVTFDAKKLLTLAKALNKPGECEGRVTLLIDANHPDSSIGVLPLDDTTSIGLLMPVTRDRGPGLSDYNQRVSQVTRQFDRREWNEIDATQEAA